MWVFTEPLQILRFALFQETIMTYSAIEIKNETSKSFRDVLACKKRESHIRGFLIRWPKYFDFYLYKNPFVISAKKQVMLDYESLFAISYNESFAL